MANSFDYKKITETLLASLPKKRDKDVLIRRYGLGLGSHETLDKIGKRYGVTRERVRQIERAAVKRLSQFAPAEVKSLSKRLAGLLEKAGGLAALDQFSAELGADSSNEQAYIDFLAQVAPDIGVIEDNRQFKTALYVRQAYSKVQLASLSQKLVEAFKNRGKPATLGQVASQLPKLAPSTLSNLAQITKSLSSFEGEWGLKSWPHVNPKSIRDRAYLAMRKHSQPLHFSEIAIHIDRITPAGRQVTTQAVHNELIKDERFVLIGRGIYALSDWGYTAGTVADIIKEVLREEQPLHKDEIVRRVLLKRQVKTTTIALNLQEKDNFLRVAKAVYKLRNP